MKKLHQQGFTNLHGVDNSEHMIEYAPKEIATYVLSNNFPKDQYEMILCNWTLHFIENKENYLQSMSDSLTDGGTMILSDKTSKDTDMIKMYHDNKLKLGVTKEVIEEKQKQLENVMFINSAEWYHKKLSELGFTVTVMDADWCFTTFLCKK